MAHRAGHRRPLPIKHQHYDIAMWAFENAARTDQRVMRAEAMRHELAIGDGINLQVGLMHVIQRIDHRDVDMLAGSGALAVEEGVTDRGEGVDPAADVGY